MKAPESVGTVCLVVSRPIITRSIAIQRSWHGVPMRQYSTAHTSSSRRPHVRSMAGPAECMGAVGLSVWGYGYGRGAKKTPGHPDRARLADDQRTRPAARAAHVDNCGVAVASVQAVPRPVCRARPATLVTPSWRA